MPRSRRGLFPSASATSALHRFLRSPIHTTYPAHIILLAVITARVEKYEFLNLPFCNFLNPVIKDALETKYFVETFINLNAFIPAYFRIKPPLVLHSSVNPNEG
jgi:hypothetical protein